MARLSHQIIEGRRTFLFLSMATSPCICHEIPIPLIFETSTRDFLMTDAFASFRFSHHMAGSCSAHPGCAADIGISVFGKKSEATICPVSALTKLALTEELPMS